MIRVLQVLDSVDNGGIQSFIMNVYRNMNRAEYQFDFLVYHTRKQFYEDEIKNLGGKIYKIPSRRESFFTNRRAISSFFSKHPEYNTIHVNISNLSDIHILVTAARENIPVRIVHAHSSNLMGNPIHKLLHYYNRLRIGKYANFYLSCSEAATKWIYGNGDFSNKVEIIKNGIDIASYKYDNNLRKEVRRRLGISNEFVIGNVGRLSQVKNHKFMFDIVQKMLNCNNLDFKPLLVLIGGGELFKALKEEVVERNIDQYVLFLGFQSEVTTMLQAFDLFILPSFYEGFPVAAIEAQASGLPVLMSDTITEAAVLNDNVKRLPINDGPNVWVNEILKKPSRIYSYEHIQAAGYDISDTIKKLKQFYR